MLDLNSRNRRLCQPQASLSGAIIDVISQRLASLERKLTSELEVNLTATIIDGLRRSQASTEQGTTFPAGAETECSNRRHYQCKGNQIRAIFDIDSWTPAAAGQPQTVTSLFEPIGHGRLPASEDQSVFLPLLQFSANPASVSVGRLQH
jgi:hypothetical protein